MNGSSVWLRRGLEFASGTWFRYAAILAGVLALVAVLSSAPLVLVALGFVPLLVVIGLRLVQLRAASGNLARAQALLPTLERHLAGSRSRWVLKAAAEGRVVMADLRELLFLRDGRTRVRVWVVERDQPDEHVMVASAGDEEVVVEHYRFGHVQEKRLAPLDDFYSVR